MAKFARLAFDEVPAPPLARDIVKRDEGGKFSHENVGSTADIRPISTQSWEVSAKNSRKFLGHVHKDAPSNSFAAHYNSGKVSSGHPSVNHAAAHILNNTKYRKFL